MKMQRFHYTILLTMIASLPRDKVLAHKAQNLGVNKTKRFIWDLFYSAMRNTPLNFNKFAISDRLYDYLDDTHIETAMRKIAKQLDYI
jgi:hypothetical protein